MYSLLSDWESSCTAELPVIWDAVTLAWRHCNVEDYQSYLSPFQELIAPVCWRKYIKFQWRQSFIRVMPVPVYMHIYIYIQGLYICALIVSEWCIILLCTRSTAAASVDFYTMNAIYLEFLLTAWFLMNFNELVIYLNMTIRLWKSLSVSNAYTVLNVIVLCDAYC